jgi:hypothetical protein
MVEAAKKLEGGPEIRVTAQGTGKLLLEGLNFSPESGPWTARIIDDQRVIVRGKRGETGVTQPTSSGSLNSLMYKNLLLGLIQDGWSGTLHVDTFHGIKKIFFFHGQIIFGSSSIIDDRLGEILYREAQITIDQLTYAAAQVTKAKRFGQVLVSKGGMTNHQLWKSLVAQVQHIVRSTFMVSQVYFEMEEGGAPPAAEIAMTTSSKEMVQEMFAYGVGFRSFLERLTPTSKIIPNQENREAQQAQLPMGTFLGDFMEMISSKPSIEQILNASKLIDIYTVAAIYQINCLGYCKIEPYQDFKHFYGPSLAPLRNKIEAYSFVLTAVKKAFQEGQVTFPQDEVREFARQHNHGHFSYVYLNDDLTLARDSIAGLYNQCQFSPERIQVFDLQLESLIQFLFQLTGDHLKFVVAKQLRQEYRSVSG